MEAKINKICKKCGEEKSLEQFPKNGKYYKNQCKICINTYHKDWSKINRDKRRICEYKWRKNNKERYLKVRNIAETKRYHERKNTDSIFYIKLSLRRRLSQALKNNYKSGSAVSDLGCSIEFLKTYLESKFQPGMIWDNRGSWHIDHIKPLASFDLTDRKQFLKANHYTNLQPLWAKDNLEKGCKYVES